MYDEPVTQTIAEHIADITTGVTNLFKLDPGQRIEVAQYIGERRRPGLVHLEVHTPFGPDVTTAQLDYVCLIEHYRGVSPGPGLRYEVGALLYLLGSSRPVTAAGPSSFHYLRSANQVERVKLYIRVTDDPGQEVAPTTP